MKIRTILFSFDSQPIYRKPRTGEKPDLPDGDCYDLPEDILTIDKLKRLMSILYSWGKISDERAFGAITVTEDGGNGPVIRLIMPNGTSDICMVSLEAYIEKLKCPSMNIGARRAEVDIVVTLPDHDLPPQERKVCRGCSLPSDYKILKQVSKDVLSQLCDCCKRLNRHYEECDSCEDTADIRALIVG